MALPKGNWATDTFTNIATRTKAQSALVRQWLNKASVDIKAYINDTLTPAIDTALATISGSLTSHAGDTDNPHGVTKDQMGLGYVDNTSDSMKPISVVCAEALGELDDRLGTAETNITNISTDIGGVLNTMSEHTENTTDPHGINVSGANAVAASRIFFDGTTTGNYPTSICEVDVPAFMAKVFSFKITGYDKANTHVESFKADGEATRVLASASSTEVKCTVTKIGPPTATYGANALADITNGKIKIVVNGVSASVKWTGFIDIVGLEG